jgi:hypothetical protein
MIDATNTSAQKGYEAEGPFTISQRDAARPGQAEPAQSKKKARPVGVQPVRRVTLDGADLDQSGPLRGTIPPRGRPARPLRRGGVGLGALRFLGFVARCHFHAAEVSGASSFAQCPVALSTVATRAISSRPM